MHIWKLTPVAVDDPAWAGSSHRGPVLVRAPDEARARNEAQKAFGVPTRFPPGTGFAVAVCRRHEFVQAEVTQASQHGPEGPIGVLEPAFDRDLAARPRGGAA